MPSGAVKRSCKLRDFCSPYSFARLSIAMEARRLRDLCNRTAEVRGSIPLWLHQSKRALRPTHEKNRSGSANA